jgi:DNA-binding NarL/FixJ family response regulator
VRVVLINNTPLIMEGLTAMLAHRGDQVEVVGEVSATAQLSSTLAPLDADVVLVDIHRQGSGGLGPVSELMAMKLPVRVVIFTNNADERCLFEALRLGVSGYLLKSLGSASLADHLVRAGDGEVVVDPTLAARITRLAVHLGNGASWPGAQLGLSRRESEVLRLLVEGRSNRLIGDELVVGPETVKTHLRHIYRKLGVSSRAEAVAKSLRQDLFSDGIAGHPQVAPSGSSATSQRPRLTGRRP